MPTLRRTAQAEEDLIEIWLYIAADNEAAADRLLDRFEDAFIRLSENAQLGPARPDITPDLRYLPIENYLVLYESIQDGVNIVRVIHGARRLTDLVINEA